MIQQYYHIPGITDEAKMREEAEYRFRTEGRVSVIHQHRSDESCNAQCADIDKHLHNAQCVDGCEVKAEWLSLEGGRHVR